MDTQKAHLSKAIEMPQTQYQQITSLPIKAPRTLNDCQSKESVQISRSQSAQYTNGSVFSAVSDLPEPHDTTFSYVSSFQHFLRTLGGGFCNIGTADDAGQLPLSDFQIKGCRGGIGSAVPFRFGDQQIQQTDWILSRVFQPFPLPFQIFPYGNKINAEPQIYQYANDH